MQPQYVVDDLKNYLSNNVLNGKDIGLDASTPLLEWGILNSIEMVRMVTYLQTQFDVEIPPEKVLAENFKDLESIATLVTELS